MTSADHPSGRDGDASRLRRVRVLVSGRVQGVFFRSTTQDVAARVGATGWIRNRPDGRVEAEVQGPADAVEQVVDFLHDGPPQAQVAAVEAREADPVDGERRFEVR